MFIKKKLKYFTRPKQISPDLSGVSGDFRIVCNNVVRIEDTAIKWRFIVHVGCINKIKGKNWILGCLKYKIMFLNMQYYFAYL